MTRAVLVAALVSAAPLHAQTNLSGFVRDSLTGGPLAGAVVQLIPAATPWAAGQSATADASGKYLMPGVTAGRYLFGFQHPRLDSLGLDAVSITLDVPAGTPNLRADLALPSSQTFVRTLCGARNDSTGALVGRVLNADDGSALPAGSVLVRWAELRVDAGGVRRVPAQVVAQFGSDGRYVACGVPTDAPLAVRARLTKAAGDSASRTVPASGEVNLQFSKGSLFMHRDLLVSVSDAPTTAGARGARTGTARLTGRIVAENNRGVANVRVSLRESDAVAITDTSGTFRLANLPAGTRGIDITAIGYLPVQLVVDLRPNRDVVANAMIEKATPMLDSVRVRTSIADKAGFLKRRASGVGHFITAADIEASGAMNVGMAVMNAPTLRVNGFDPTNPTRPIVSGRGKCDPTVWVDNQPIRDGLTGADDLLSVRRLGGIEVYANPAEAPPQFTGIGARAGSRTASTGCAVIIIWTKSYVP